MIKIQKKVLITAGPTREYIDPVRYISNRSSGKMGYFLAEAFVEKRAQVKLITGPSQQISNFKSQISTLKVVDVETAEQMGKAVLDNFEWADIIIMAAAVADYRPVKKAKHKIKKSNFPLYQRGIKGDLNKESDLILKLEKTADILAEIGKKKRSNQILIGFALETENLLINAQKKLAEKNLDLVIANNEKAIDNNTADFIIVEKESYEKLKQITKQQLANILANRLII